jgi:hypothetical protein
VQGPSTQDLLAAWEHGRALRRQADRALALLAAAYTDIPRGALAQLSIGERDRLLLALREQAFGSRLAAITVCPGCGARLEMEFEAGEVCTAPRPSEQAHDAATPLRLRHADYDVTFRLPNSLDLSAVSEFDPLDESRRRLIERLVTRATRGDEPIAAQELPEDVVNALDARLAEADPQAEILLSLDCAECSRNWQAPFDIVSFLWSEVDAWAVRLLREVHWLARAYAWREADILALSPWRRQCYLELLSE